MIAPLIVFLQCLAEWTSQRVDDHCFLPSSSGQISLGAAVGDTQTLSLSQLSADRVTDCMPYPISSRSTAIRGGMDLDSARNRPYIK